MSITDAIYHDEEAARAHLEGIRWPNGAVCPFCNKQARVKALGGGSMGAGWYHCGECRKKFTVRVGTVWERSHIPLHKWVHATHLLSASKKGISAHQLHRMLGITYKSAWFMAMRIREAMRAGKDFEPMGGNGKTVEIDETFIGGKRRGVGMGGGVGHKDKVMSIVERGGNLRSFHVASVGQRELRPILKEQIAASATVHTDEASYHRSLGKDFAKHEVVNHRIGEYVRGDIYTNTLEGYFSILKRGIGGIYQNVSAKHLKRYVGEFDFRYNHRIARGFNDIDRATLATKGAEGKRLTYRRTGIAEA